MERLQLEDRKDLVWAMRRALLEQVNSGVLTESANASAVNFILNEATYEQLLNLAFNPNREEKYLPAAVLEGVAVKVYENFVSEADGKKDDASPAAKKSIWDKTKAAATAAKELAVKPAKKLADVMAKKGIEREVAGKKGAKALQTAAVGLSKHAGKATVGVAALPVAAAVAHKLYKKHQAKKA